MEPRLPLDIWFLIICEHISEKHTRTLRTLCKVSKDIAQIAQSVLFRLHNFNFGWWGKTHLPFLRSILDSPRLAAYVQRVILPAYLEADETDTDMLTEIYDRIAARLGFDPTVFPLDLNEIDEETDRMPAIFLLLLPLLPNLQNLTIATRHENPFALLVHLHEAGIVKPFTSVLHVGLCYGDTESGFNLLPCSPLLALTPNVATLRLEQCSSVIARRNDGDGGLGALAALRQNMPPGIKNLYLDNCQLDYPCFRTLLACCPRLERFSYYSGGGLIGDGDEPLSSEVIDSLRPAQATLRWLVLDFRGSCGSYFNDGDNYAQITQESFADFPALEKLSCEGKVLLDREG